MQRYPTPAVQVCRSESHFNLNPAWYVHWLTSSLRQTQGQALGTLMLTLNQNLFKTKIGWHALTNHRSERFEYLRIQFTHSLAINELHSTSIAPQSSRTVVNKTSSTLTLLRRQEPYTCLLAVSRWCEPIKLRRPSRITLYVDSRRCFATHKRSFTYDPFLNHLVFASNALGSQRSCPYMRSPHPHAVIVRHCTGNAV